MGGGGFGMGGRVGKMELFCGWKGVFVVCVCWFGLVATTFLKCLFAEP